MDNLEDKRQECQIFSRVCGWLVPRHAMNLGKQEEKKDIKVYNHEVSLNHEYLK